MPRRLTFVSCASLAALLSVSVTTPGQAQIGRIKKIGADAAKDAAMGKKPEDPTAAKVTYEITAERVTAIVTALTPALAAAQRDADAKAVTAAYDAKYKAANECFSKAAGGTPDPASMQGDKYTAIATKLSSVSERLTAAVNAKRHRESIALQDTALVLQISMGAMLFKHSCPAMPYKPVAMIDQLAAQMASHEANPSGGSNELQVPPEARAGMTTGQWGRVRERMAVWLLIQSGDLPATSEKFTDAEQAVLSARSAEIKKFGPLFKSGSMQWVHWTDVKSW